MLVENRGDVVILAPRHRVDTNNSPEVEKVVFENIGDGEGKMVIDFSQVDYISSAGLRVILKATKALKREEGKMMLCDMQDYVKEVFEIAGFDSFLTIVGTMDDALQAF